MAITRERVDGAAVLEKEKRYVLHPWASQSKLAAPVMVGAKGCTLWDADGKEYLDFSSQLCNVHLGFQDQRVVDAIVAQAQQLCYVSPVYLSEPRARLAELIARIAPGDLNQSYFVVGGSEANEAAIQLARLCTGRTKILSFYRGYHGATYGAHSVSGGTGRHAAGLGIPGVVHVLEQDADQVDQIIQLEGANDVAAVILEPIRVGDGVAMPPPGFLASLRAVCDRHGVLLIFDEVVTGFGRTGKWFACDHWNVVPDMMTLAKGLNSGYAALGAVVVSDRVAAHFRETVIPFGFTNGGQPLAFASAIAVIEALREDKLVERSAWLGEVLLAELRHFPERHPSVGEVRGLGIMAGVELVKNQRTREPLVPPLAPRNVAIPSVLDGFKKHLLDHGLIAPVGGNVLRLYPPLCVTEEELHRGLRIVDEALALTDALVDPA